MQPPWEKSGVALKLDKTQARYTVANRNFNEIEWLNTDYKSRKYFMEPGTLFLWETAPWVWSICIIPLQRIPIHMLLLIKRGFHLNKDIILYFRYPEEPWGYPAVQVKGMEPKAQWEKHSQLPWEMVLQPAGWLGIRHL